jgi:outer membrane lipoprotein-sorting protein
MKERWLSIRRKIWLALATAALACSAGCVHVSKKTNVPAAQIRPLLESNKADLISKYNQQAHAIQSINAGVTLTPKAGSQYSGVIEEYHEVNGFILAQRPANIRVIGQAPVVKKNIFDMVSDGETFRIYIPSKNKFITGPDKFEKPADKPIENLRPQHLLDAIFWKEIPEGRTVLFDESDDAPNREYVLTVLQRASEGAALEVESRIHFDRTALNVDEIETFHDGGRLDSIIHFQDWQPAGDAQYPHTITVGRPHDDYQLGIRVTKLAVNETIAPERFHLAQPPGTELVEVDKLDTKDQGAKP